MDIIICSVQATLTVVFVCSSSVWLSRRKIITPEIIKGLSTLVINLFNPCLIFFNIGPSVTAAALLRWWPIPFYCVFYIAVGVGTGWVLGRVLSLTGGQCRYTMACLAFGNTTSIPLAITVSIMSSKWELFRQSDLETQQVVYQRAVSYIMFMTVFQTMGRWTIAYRLLANTDTYSSLRAEESVTVENEQTQRELPAAENEGGGRSDSSSREVSLQFHRIVSNVKASLLTLQECVNPPLIACVAAIFAGVVPPVKLLLFDTSFSFLAKVLMQSGKMIGGCAVPAILLILGGHLRDGPEAYSDEVPRSLLVSIIGCRLAVIPSMTFLLIFIMRQLNFMVQDPTMALALMLCNVGPTAINLLVIATQHNMFVKATATLHFYAYLASNVTTTLWVIAFLWYVT